MSNTIYLITGASRGIGLGLVSHLVSTDRNAIVYAGCRDPLTSTALSALAIANPSQVKVVKMEATSEEDAKAAAELIKSTFGRLDVVIVNAGIADTFLDAATVPLEAMRRHFEINTLGPLLVYQATHALLSTSASARPGPPKFVYISTISASIGLNIPYPVVAYGASKAAGNMVLAKIHLQSTDSDLVVLCLHPGNVQTELGLSGGKALDALDAFDTTVEDSVRGVLKVIAAAKREEKIQFLDHQGGTLPW